MGGKAPKIATRIEYKVSAFTDRDECRKRFHEILNSLQDGHFEGVQYYGIGGMGKTQLLHKLMEEVEEGEDNHAKPIYVHIPRFMPDGRELELPDFLYYLSRHIMAATDQKNAFPWFDITLAGWLEFNQQNPDEYVEGLKRQYFEAQGEGGNKGLKLLMTGIGIASDFFSIPEKSVEVLGDMVKSLANRVRNYLDRDEEAILKAPTEISNACENGRENEKLVEEFIFDAQNILNESNIKLVIMLDEYERLVSKLKDNDKARIKDAKIRKIMVGLPNVLWVIASREKLDRIGGEDEYPFFDDEHEPYQFAIDNLSENDAIQYFNEMGILDENLQSYLFNLTEGTPIYMYFCYMRYEQQKAKKGQDYTPTAEDFGGYKDELVKIYLQDFEENNLQAILMLAAIGNPYSREMAQYVADKAHRASVMEAPFETISNLSIVERNGDSYKLHGVFRDIVREYHGNVNPEKRNEYVQGTIEYYDSKIRNEQSNLKKIYWYKELVRYVLNEDAQVVGRNAWESIIYQNTKKTYGMGLMRGHYQEGFQILESIRQKLECEEWKELIDSIDEHMWLDYRTIMFGDTEAQKEYLREVVAKRENEFGELDLTALKFRITLSDLTSDDETVNGREIEDKIKEAAIHSEYKELLDVAELAITEGLVEDDAEIFKYLYLQWVAKAGEYNIDTVKLADSIGRFYSRRIGWNFDENYEFEKNALHWLRIAEKGYEEAAGDKDDLLALRQKAQDSIQKVQSESKREDSLEESYENQLRKLEDMGSEPNWEYFKVLKSLALCSLKEGKEQEGLNILEREYNILRDKGDGYRDAALKVAYIILSSYSDYLHEKRSDLSERIREDIGDDICYIEHADIAAQLPKPGEAGVLYGVVRFKVKTKEATRKPDIRGIIKNILLNLNRDEAYGFLKMFSEKLEAGTSADVTAKWLEYGNELILGYQRFGCWKEAAHVQTRIVEEAQKLWGDDMDKLENKKAALASYMVKAGNLDKAKIIFNELYEHQKGVNGENSEMAVKYKKEIENLNKGRKNN